MSHSIEVVDDGSVPQLRSMEIRLSSQQRLIPEVSSLYNEKHFVLKSNFATFIVDDDDDDSIDTDDMGSDTSDEITSLTWMVIPCESGCSRKQQHQQHDNVGDSSDTGKALSQPLQKGMMGRAIVLQDTPGDALSVSSSCSANVTTSSTTTSTEIGGGNSVVQGIMSFLKEHSIPATVRARNQNATSQSPQLIIRCQIALTGLAFVIYIQQQLQHQQQYGPSSKQFTQQLKDVNDDDSNSDSVVTVQVQRRRGCCIELQRLRQALFASLQQQQQLELLECNRSSGAENSISSYGTKHIGSIPLELRKGAPIVDASEEDGRYQKSLTTSLTLLSPSSHCSDVRLGLESLRMHFDQPKSKSVELTSHALVYGGNETGDSLRAALWRCLMVTRHNSNSHYESFAVEVDADAIAPPIGHDDVRALALQILIQALKLQSQELQQPGDLPSLGDAETIGSDTALTMLDLSKDEFWRGVVRVCRYNMAHAVKRPCVAALSMGLVLSLMPVTSPVDCVSCLLLPGLIHDDDMDGLC